jgi:hypothetical protein
MKKQGIIVIVIMSLVLFAGCTNHRNDTGANDKTIVIVSHDYPYYENESAIYEKASIVIRGTVIDKRAEYMSHVGELTEEQKKDPKLNPGGEVDKEKEFTTIYKIQVTDSFKGKVLKDDIVEIKQFGGETDDTIYIDEGAPQIEQKREYIMFLETYENSPATLLNDVQSLYSIDKDKLISHTDNDFNMTIEKLEALSKGQ